MSATHAPQARSARKRNQAHRRWGNRVWATALSFSLTVALSLPALALDGRITSRPSLEHPSAQAGTPASSQHSETDEKAPEPRLSRWLKRTLGGLPLRPVQIGPAPRLPDDPEPGLGVVLHLAF